MKNKSICLSFCRLAAPALFLTAMLAALPSANAETKQNDDTLSYYYFKDARPLLLDNSRVAVFGEGAIGTSALDRAGLAGAPVKPLAVKGWSLVGNSSDGDIRDVAKQLSKAGGDAFVSPVFFDDLGGPLIPTPFVLVQFDEAVTIKEARAALAGAGFDASAKPDWAGLANAFRTRADAAKLKDGFAVIAAANTLARRADVVFAETDMIFTGKAAYTPNDTGFSNCWGLNNTGQTGGTTDADMDAVEAWDTTFGSSSIITVVIDTGVEQTHPDINQMTGMDFTTDGNSLQGGPVNACDRHGTPVAGCVSATADNSLGTAGVAPGTLSTSARSFISNTPTCDGSWTASSSWTVDALAWAETIGARVTNNSNGYGFSSSAVASKYASTRANGIVHFASMGNDSSTIASYPASLSDVVGVIALNDSGARASFSNYGYDSGISAPGAFIYSTDRTGSDGYVGGDYAFVNGTSFASPYTAGCAALLLSYAPGLTAVQVETTLFDSAVDLGAAGYDTDFGWGFVNIRAALDAVIADVDDWTMY